MRKFMKKISVLWITVCCLAMFTACSSKEPVDTSVVLGTWVKTYDDMTTTYIIREDGSYSETSETSGDYAISITEDGTYTYDGNRLEFTTDSDYEYGYAISFEGNTMLMTNEDNDHVSKFVKQ